MKMEIIVQLLLLVVGLSAQYSKIGTPIYPLDYSSSQDLLDLFSKSNRHDYNFFTGTRNNVRSHRLLEILKRTTAYTPDGNIPTDKYSYFIDEQSAQKRGRACDTRKITIETILEYLRSGRICGFRVSTFRFGLGGRK